MKNNRTFLEKLLDGAEVEWKPLMDLAEIGTGNSNRQDEEENGKYPFYVRSKNILRSNSFQFDETAIIIPGEGGIGDIFHYVEGKYALHQRAYRIHITSDEVNTKFLYYIMHNSFKKYILSKSVGATAISIRKPMLEKFEIPIPPLSVQTEIVKILDALTALTSELTSELILRQKQYEYYREKLLSEEELGKVGVQWKALGEIVPISRGKRLIRSQLKDNDQYPVYQNSLQPLGYYDHKNCRAYMTFVIAAGAAGEIGFSNVEFWAADDCYYFDCANKILHDKFLYYFLLSNKHLLTNQVRKASVPRLSRVSIEKIKIPIVSFKEQERIVAILDKFETLTNSITEGLPLAIEQSQKRYEYYRELLLNFS